MNERKALLLHHLAQVPDAAAGEVAAAAGISLPAAGMALVRLVRAGLATRAWDPHRRSYFYSISPRGEARVKFFSDRRS
jgi:DNA-binding MarR family transcriptional regulator